jgi:Ca2+-binding RTX toxin-like protein
MELQGTQGVDTLTGGADNDTIYGYGGNDTLKGGAGDDVLAGNDGNDILQGGDGDDYILGGAGNDTIDGGAGNDWAAYEDATTGVKVDLTVTGTQNTVGAGTDKLTSIENVYGSAFNDTLTGNAEANMLVGGAGNDTVSGAKGDDTLWGSAGNDTLDGGDGDDYMVGGSGDDVLKGGVGSDWASYEDATAGVTVDLNKTTQQDTVGAGNDTLNGVENLWGSKFADVLTGDASDNYLWGDEGNDVINGGAGDDHISGGRGANRIDGGDGWDTVDYAFSEVGVTINLNEGAAPPAGSPLTHDYLRSIEAAMGSAHDDVIIGNGAENYLYGDAGNDKIYGNSGHDTLEGGYGDDYLLGWDADLLLGGAGNDTIELSGVAKTSTIDGGDGGDTLDLHQLIGNTGLKVDLRLTGVQEIARDIKIDIANIENLIGSGGDDHLIGNEKENVLLGSYGDDILDGGAGSDTVSYDDGLPGGVVIDLNKSVQVLGFTTRGKDTLISIENVIGSANADTITGNAEANRLSGGDGADQLFGMAGADILEGGNGDDVVDGGEGLDIASYEHTITSVRVDLTKAGVAQNTHGAGSDTLSNVEGLKGSAYDDVLVGDAKDNTFEGGRGDDIIDGGAGSDTAIYNGASADYAWSRNANGAWTVTGAEGVDTLLNVETLKFSDRSVALSPSTTTVKVDDLIKPVLVMKSGQGELRDAVLSADGKLAFISDAAGNVSVVETASGAARATLKVGTDLGGMDVSPDGRYLVVAEHKVEQRYSPGGAQSLMARVHVVDLHTGEVKDYATYANGDDRGFTDAAFSSDGMIVLSQDSVGTGPTALTLLDPGTGEFERSYPAYTGSGYISVSRDHTAGLLAPGSTTGATLNLLKASSAGPGFYYSGYVSNEVGGNNGIQAIATGGTFSAQFANGLHLFGDDLTLRFDLSAAAPEIAEVYGMAFSPDSKHLYVVDGASDKIFEFSTATGRIEHVYSAGGDIAPVISALESNMYANRVSLANDGDHMLVASAYGVSAFNLSRLAVEPGTGAADTIFGTDGADTLRGYAGDDMLAGGKGADTLVGGLGSDTFVFSAGDSTWDMFVNASVDVVNDWQATDHLSFGHRAEPVRYGEATATNLMMAKTIAPQVMGSQHLTHLAMQVGDDVYVFVTPNGATDGSSETVVKLANTTLDKISADNFLPVGDSGDNVLVGSDFNDTLNGFVGNDTLRGGKGSDVLIGGAGNDLFQFAKGDSLAANRYTGEGVDTIVDFQPGDKLQFDEDFSGEIAFTRDKADDYYSAGFVADFMLFGTSVPTSIRVAQVGADTYVFVGHTEGRVGHMDNIVKLVGVSADTLQLSDFVTT